MMFSQDAAPEPMQADAPFEEVVNEEPYIVENSHLDLESYANSYNGLAKIHRLMYVADHCPSLRIEALTMAISCVKRTYNISLYAYFQKKLAQAQSLPDLQIDEAWMSCQSKKASLKLEKLDMDLKNYKSNSIKESIRRGYDDLGHHYLNCGDLGNALKCYSRSRDYCTTPTHILCMCWNVAKVSIYLKNWTHVVNAVSRAETACGPNQSGEYVCKVLVTRLKIASALALLAQAEYKSAAKIFLETSIECCDTLEILTPGNIAVYTGLCALATFDRKELEACEIFKPGFKPFLEMEPQLRDIIYKFYESKYDSCLSMLDEIQNNLLLDMYIGPHIYKLYREIRKRALIQYFIPYLSVDMRRMATAFNRTVPELEDELMQIILDGQIQARIDSTKKILFAKDADLRSVAYEKTIKLGQQYKRQTRLLILRAAMIKSKIHVKDPLRRQQRDDCENNANVPMY